MPTRRDPWPVRAKASIKSRFPNLTFLYECLTYPADCLESTIETFSRHYKDRMDRGEESASGTGSTLLETAGVRQWIPALIKEMGFTSLLDAPCGDFHWLKEVDLGVRYTGVDIVPEQILENGRLYGNSLRTFLALDITRDPLPRADVILCRDCTIHLSFRQIHKVLQNLKASRSSYLLTTTFPDQTYNRNIITGRMRRINLQLPPFNFPPPILLKNEGSELIPDKSLGLWKLEDISR